MHSESTNLRRSGGSGFRTLDSRIRSVIQIATKIVSLGPWAMPYPSKKFRQNPFTSLQVIRRTDRQTDRTKNITSFFGGGNDVWVIICGLIFHLQPQMLHSHSCRPCQRMYNVYQFYLMIFWLLNSYWLFDFRNFLTFFLRPLDCVRDYTGKPIWILLQQETVSGSGISWAICKSAPWPRQITTSTSHHSVFLQAGCPSCRPTNSIKTLKALEWYAAWEIRCKGSSVTSVPFKILVVDRRCQATSDFFPSVLSCCWLGVR